MSISETLNVPMGFPWILMTATRSAALVTCPGVRVILSTVPARGAEIVADVY